MSSGLGLGLLFVALTLCGCGGGGSGDGSASSTGSTSSTSSAGSTGSSGSSGSAPGSTPSSGKAPTLVQLNTYQTQNTNGENNSNVSFKAATTKGNAIWVAVTVADYGGVHSISISDSQGNTFTQLDQQNDGAPGSQSVAHFYAANIVGDAAAPDTITVDWGYDDYKGILITEIAGVTAAPLVGHTSMIQDGLAAGTNNVTAGPITVASAQTPALLLAVSMNTSGGSSDTGGSGYPGPAAGSGMTSEATFWDWGQNLATFVTATVTDAESISSVFNAPDTDSFVTVAAVFH
jgi:hypothetical protein